jgi:hypothetical protein
MPALSLTLPRGRGRGPDRIPSLKKRDPIPSPSVRRGGGLGWGQTLREPTRGRYKSPQTLNAVPTTSRNFAACTSGVMSLPCTVLEKPHWGDSASWSSGT